MIDRYGVNVPTPSIRREVLPVVRRRLEAAAVSAGVFGLAFWTYALLW